MKNYQAGMFVFALAYLSGITFIQQLAALPDITQLIFLTVAALCLYLIVRYFLCQLNHALSTKIFNFN